MRPLWKGAVSFGLVYVPVKLYAATEHKDIRFNYLHQNCKTPIQYRRYCPLCQAEAPMEEIVRGYEYEKGSYVIMAEEDFSYTGGDGGRNINIMDFVNLVDIDPVYFEKAYYLAPAEGGAKVYELLKRAMSETGKVAVARIVIRSRESLAALRVSGNYLVMSTMHYPDEVRQAATLPELNYQVNLHDNEVKMAISLINSLSTEFQPEKYDDTYTEGLMEIIQAKIAGEEIATPSQRETGKVVDLMEALKASIDLAKEERFTDKQANKAKGLKEAKVKKETSKRKTS